MRQGSQDVCPQTTAAQPRPGSEDGSRNGGLEPSEVCRRKTQAIIKGWRRIAIATLSRYLEKNLSLNGLAFLQMYRML